MHICSKCKKSQIKHNFSPPEPKDPELEYLFCLEFVVLMQYFYVLKVLGLDLVGFWERA
jgi:hypothetical protein